MIDQALKFIADTVNRYLQNRFALESDTVILNNLVDADGSVPQQNQNKIVLTLINLEHETATQYYGGQTRIGTTVITCNPPIHFNLDLLITASFSNYQEAVKFLTATITFFQTNSSLNPKKFPDIPNGITALNVEVENAPYRQSHNLWSALGAKYQPSIIYKIRHVTVQADAIQGTNPCIQDASSMVSPK